MSNDEGEGAAVQPQHCNTRTISGPQLSEHKWSCSCVGPSGEEGGWWMVDASCMRACMAWATKVVVAGSWWAGM